MAEMKWTAKVFIITSLLACSATANADNTSLMNIFRNDFIQFISADWDRYVVKEYFSKQKKDYAYLNKTFGKKILQQSLAVASTELNIEDMSELDGGYEFGITLLKYADKDTATDIHTIIRNSGAKNLKGGKIFIAYTSRQCGNSIAILHSSAVLSDKVKNYFRHVEDNNICQEQRPPHLN